jgi:hypothetical protein
LRRLSACLQRRLERLEDLKREISAQRRVWMAWYGQTMEMDPLFVRNGLDRVDRVWDVMEDETIDIVLAQMEVNQLLERLAGVNLH